ncbi:MAG: sulfotransferase [wastewater metagenome]|nr:sulfotransferase [Candidatus Loosdrechtia aerotolerans]
MDPLYITTRPGRVVNRFISYLLFEGRPLTTKGRWINPFLFFLFSIEKKLPQLKKVKKPVFILGTGRSGTTILGLILSMHRDVGFLNEPKAMWYSIYQKEDIIGNYTQGDAYYRLSADEVTEEIRYTAHRLYGAYLTVSRSKRVIDKYPELIFRVPFVKAIFPDARFIFLVRNGWSVIQSIHEWSERLGIRMQGKTHDWWGVNNRKWHLLVDQIVANDSAFTDVLSGIRNLTSHKDMAAVEWGVTMNEGLSVMEQYPDAVKLIRYEDLIQNPVDVLTTITDFCGLPHDDAVHKYAVKVLRPASSYTPGNLHPLIQCQFDETMSKLGYR